MQGRSRHIATDPNPAIATKNLDVSRFIACSPWLYLARRRRCHDRKKQWPFLGLANNALRTKLARSVLPPPLEQHVGVEPMAQRQFRDGYFRLAGFNGQAALEFSRVIRLPRPTPRNNFICIQNGPRYFVWRATLSLTITQIARRFQNDAYQQRLRWSD